MGFYIKKPAMIEAVKWDPDEKPTNLPDWFWNLISNNPEVYDEETGDLKLENIGIVEVGDFVVRELSGDIHRVESSTFEETHEAV